MKILVDSIWSHELQSYIPCNYRIEGEDNILISGILVAGADPDYLSIQGNVMQFGPYRLEIISRDVDTYTCKLVDTYTCKLIDEGAPNS